jgi:hypothetical protein
VTAHAVFSPPPHARGLTQDPAHTRKNEEIGGCIFNIIKGTLNHHTGSCSQTARIPTLRASPTTQTNTTFGSRAVHESRLPQPHSRGPRGRSEHSPPPRGHAPHEGRPHVVITHHPSRRHHSRRCQSLHAISEHKRLNLTQPETNTAEALTAHLQRTARRPRHTHRNHKPHTPRFRVPVPKPSRAPAPQAAPALCTQPSSRGPAMVLGLGPGPPSPSESQDRHPHRLLGARQTRLRRRGNRK